MAALRRSPFSALIVILIEWVGLVWLLVSASPFLSLAFPAMPHNPQLYQVQMLRTRSGGSMSSAAIRPRFRAAPHVLVAPQDMNFMLSTGHPVRYAAVYTSKLLASAEAGIERLVRVRFATPDLFSLFELSFESGGAWSGAEPDAPRLVLSAAARDGLFGSRPSVGEQVMLGGQAFTVSGVLERNTSTHALFDLNKWDQLREAVFVPFGWGEILQASPEMALRGSVREEGSPTEVGQDDAYLSVWVELLPGASVDQLQQRMRAYASGLRAREGIELQIALRRLRQWRIELNFVPPLLKLNALLAPLAFLVCISAMVQMLFVRFEARIPELGLQRALGASQKEIQHQLQLESAVMCLIGGVLSIPAAHLVLKAILEMMPAMDETVQLDFRLGLATVCLAPLFGWGISAYAGRVISRQSISSQLRAR